MTIAYWDGFAINVELDRVQFEDAQPFYQKLGMPFTANGLSAGEPYGPVTGVSVRGAFDELGKTVYIDVSKNPYSGPTIEKYGYLLASDGRFLCDSKSPVAIHYNNVPKTAAGYVCMVDDDIPPGELEYVVTETGALVSTEDGTNITT